MKKLILFLLASLLATAWCFPTVSVAKTVYIKKDGETLGHIAVGCDHPVTDWRMLRSFNSQLPKPVEIRPGVWDVLVHNGDPVDVPDGWDCRKLDPEFASEEKIPAISEPAPSSEGTEKSVIIKNDPTPKKEDGRSLWWLRNLANNNLFWIILIIFVIALITLAILKIADVIRARRQRRLQPIIPRGNSPGESERIEARFNRIAERHYGETNPYLISEKRPVRIGPIEHGYMNGRGRVEYRDQTVERRLENEPAYRARFRFPDGTEQELFFLQACGNDVYAGTRYSGFTFTADRVILTAPAPVVKTAKTTTATASEEKSAGEAPSTTPETITEEPQMAPDAVEASSIKPASDDAEKVVENLKEVLITITEKDGQVLVSVQGHEKILPTKIEKGELRVFFPRGSSS